MASLKITLRSAHST